MAEVRSAMTASRRFETSLKRLKCTARRAGPTFPTPKPISDKSMPFTAKGGCFRGDKR